MGQTLSLEETIRNEAHRHNNVHLMMVDGISKLMSRQVERIVSADFSVGGLKWNIILYTEENYLHFGLIISHHRFFGSNWKVNCTVKLTLYSCHGSSHRTHKTRVCLDANSIKLTERIRIKHMGLYRVNDRSVVSAEITEVEPQGITVSSASIPRSMGTAECIKLMEVQRNIIWKIPNFSSVSEGRHTLTSLLYTVGPVRWCIRMCPKGTLEGQGNSLSLFLEACGYESGPMTNTLAVYKLRVLDRLTLGLKHHEIGQQFWFGCGNFHGDTKFLALEELYKASNGFLVNDEIHIGVEFFYVSTTENMI